MTRPTPTDIHLWDGTPNLPPWLHWNGAHIVLPGRDDTTQPQPGWTLVRWSDGHITVASPQAADRVYGPHGIWRRLQRAEAELARVRTVATDFLHEHEGGPDPCATAVLATPDTKDHT